MQLPLARLGGFAPADLATLPVTDARYTPLVVPAPTNSSSAADKGDVDAIANAYLPLAGGSISGSLSVGGTVSDSGTIQVGFGKLNEP